MSELKDWRGTEIEVGSRIVYPGRASSSMWMNEAVVKSIATKYVSRWQGDGEDVTTLTVVRIDCSGGYGDPPDGKTTMLTVLNRVTVVGPRV